MLKNWFLSNFTYYSTSILFSSFEAAEKASRKIEQVKNYLNYGDGEEQ